VRLAKFFGTSEGFWMNLQSFYEVRAARKRIAKELGRIEPQKAKPAA
jgi:plasmid maintenance system antidote protein VapI